MTDPVLPPDDEVVSAHLDGVATPSEAARVEADPRAQTRLRELGAIRTRVAESVRPSAQVRESAIAAALDVFDRELAVEDVNAAPMVATTDAAQRPSEERSLDEDGGPLIADLEAARRSRRRLRVLSAAAAVLAILFVAIGVSRLGQSSSDLASLDSSSDRLTEANREESTVGGGGTKSAGDPNVPAQGDSKAGSGAPTSGDRDPSTTTTSNRSTAAPPTTLKPPTQGPTSSEPGSTPDGSQVDLGPVSSGGQLREVVAAALTASEQTTSTSRPTPAPDSVFATTRFGACDTAIRSEDDEIDSLVLRGTATFEGKPSIVLTYTIDQQKHPDANGPLRIYALDPGTCGTLAVETIS